MEEIISYIEDYYKKDRASINVFDILSRVCWMQPVLEEIEESDATKLNYFKQALTTTYLKEFLMYGIGIPKKDIKKAILKGTISPSIDTIQYYLHEDKLITAISVNKSVYKQLFPRKNSPIGRFSQLAAVLGSIAISDYYRKICRNQEDLLAESAYCVVVNHDDQQYNVFEWENYKDLQEEAMYYGFEKLNLHSESIGFKACLFCNHSDSCKVKSTVRLNEMEENYEEWIDDVELSYCEGWKKSYDKKLDDLNKTPSKSHDDGWLHPSEMCISKCKRRFYYALQQAKKIERIPPGLRRIFNAGHIVHEILQRPFEEEDSMLIEGLVLDEEYRIKGHSDLIGEVSIGEIKSARHSAYSRYIDSPKAEHIKQASLYAEHYKRESIEILYFNKNTGSVCSHILPTDMEKVAEIKEFASEVTESFDKKEIPDRIPYVKSTCGNCPYEKVCKPKQ